MFFMTYFFVFLATFVLAISLTFFVRKVAFKLKILDQLNISDRKLHTRVTPLLGGLAIFFSFLIMALAMITKLTAGNLEWRHWLGVLIGASLLMIGGFLDDKYNLSPGKQIIFPVLATTAVIIAGVGIEKITNPFGGLIVFKQLAFLPPLLTFFWLMGMMYTTKLLDGIDGLVTGIGAIGGLVIFLFTITTRYYQPDIGLAGLIFASACLGFLIFNWHPAKIFLGEGGSLFVGFMLGVLSIISGGKIAIALLVIGLPVLDTAWTITRRLLSGKNPFRHSDRLHLHHRLMDLGLGQRKTVLIYYSLALVFGLSGLFLQSRGKLFALLLLFLLMIVMVIGLNYLPRRPKLLLHICCVGCGVYAGEILKKNYQVILYFFNPNIFPEAEYNLRLAEAQKISQRLNLKLITEEYNHNEWLNLVKGHEADPERGERCYLCYQHRLEESAKKAQELGCEYFTTTLTTSPHKDAKVINELGEKLANQYGVKFLTQDLKKNDGFKKSSELSKELGLYRQNYCGCEFSRRD